MALINRISRLFRADFNAVLDRIEEPDVLLKQALREMNEDIHRDELQFKSFQNEQSQIEFKTKELKENIEKINEELDICFESNKADLAHSQVKRKLEMQHYEKHLKNKFVLLGQRTHELDNRLQENKKRLSAMQQKLELFTTSESEMNEDEYFPNINTSINENDIEVAFLREKQARSIS